MADDILDLADRIRSLERSVDRINLKIEAIIGEGKELVFVPEKYEIRSEEELEEPVAEKVAR